MKFMIILTADAEASDYAPQAEKDRVYNAHMEVVRELESKKKLISSMRLRPSKEAVTIRSKNGKSVSVDGPFSETKEVLGGFYVIDCESRDEAVEWATKMPHFGDLRYSAMEVRQIWE